MFPQLKKLMKVITSILPMLLTMQKKGAEASTPHYGIPQIHITPDGITRTIGSPRGEYYNMTIFVEQKLNKGEKTRQFSCKVSTKGRENGPDGSYVSLNNVKINEKNVKSVSIVGINKNPYGAGNGLWHNPNEWSKKGDADFPYNAPDELDKPIKAPLSLFFCVPAYDIAKENNTVYSLAIETIDSGYLLDVNCDYSNNANCKPSPINI